MKTTLEGAPFKCLEEEHSRTGQGRVTLIMHAPYPEMHCFVFFLHIFSILGNATAAFCLYQGFSILLEKNHKDELIRPTANYQEYMETLTILHTEYALNTFLENG